MGTNAFWFGYAADIHATILHCQTSLEETSTIEETAA